MRGAAKERREVVGGMLAITALGVLRVPAFYVSVERRAEWRRR